MAKMVPCAVSVLKETVEVTLGFLGGKGTSGTCRAKIIAGVSRLFVGLQLGLGLAALVRSIFVVKCAIAAAAQPSGAVRTLRRADDLVLGLVVPVAIPTLGHGPICHPVDLGNKGLQPLALPGGQV